MPSASSWRRLRDRMHGDLVRADDPDYTVARQVALSDFDDVAPDAVVRCRDERDVASALRFATEHDLPLAVRSGGNHLLGWSTGTGLVVDLARIAHVTPADDSVHIGPGAQAVDVLAGLGPHGLQVPTGSDPTVALGGWLLGGGTGWQTRAFGLGCDRLRAARVVLADGTVVTCSEDQHPDLFWALRGAGGATVGIVTDLQVAPTPAQAAVSCFDLTFHGDPRDVLEAWPHWMLGAPEALGSTATLLALPDAPPLLLVQGGFLGPRELLDATLRQLYDLAGRRPAESDVAQLDHAAAAMRQFGCAGLTVAQAHRVGTGPDAMLPRHRYVRDCGRLFTAPLPADAVRATWAAFDAGPAAGQFHAFVMRALGGAAGRIEPDASAFAHRDARFHFGCCAGYLVSDTPDEDRALADAWAETTLARFARHSPGKAYVNFPDPALPDPGRAYFGDNLPRLREIQGHYDPEHRFQAL